MPQTALENGAGQLMSALLGGGRIEQNAQMAQQEAYDKADSLRAGLDKAITEAYLARQKRAGVDSAPQDIATLYPGATPAQAAAMAHVRVGGLATSLADAGGAYFKGKAEPLLVDQGLTPGNAALAANEGKPVPSVTISDGNIIRGALGLNPSVAPTQEGQAKIAADQARAGEYRAHAGVYDAQTAAGGFANGNPQAAVHGAAAKPEPYTDPAQAILKAAFTTTDKDGNPVYQPGDAQKFSQWRAAHPDFRNGAQALDTYQSLIDPLGHRYTNLNPVAHATTNYDGTTPIVTPAGADPNLTGEIYTLAKSAQADGHPLPLGTLRAAAEIRAHGHDFTIGPDGRAIVVGGPADQHAQAAQAIVQAATGGGKPSADLPRPRSAAEAAALPRGARYVAPDGTVRTKS